MKPQSAIPPILLLVLLGCASGPTVERGPQGTIAYNVEIESTDPGARVEANGDYVGKTPMTLKIFGDKDGTFHNFGSGRYLIQVFPVKTNQFVQTKVFRTGGWFSQEDRVPSRLYFDLNQKAEGFSISQPRY
jgi:PEGA domain